MKKFKLTLILLLVFTTCQAQEKLLTRNSFLTAGLSQVNEDANFGLVFSGPAINYGMTWKSLNEKRLIEYEYELGARILFSREIPALGFYLKPVDLNYLFKFQDKELYIGPQLQLEYNYNLYPDLQAGFDYWFTNLSLGINARYSFNYKESSFIVMLNSSLAGFTSRQAAYRNPYFYDIGFNHAIRHLNQNLSFGSVNDFNTTNLEIFWKRRVESRLTFGYCLNYYGYFEKPEITILNHGIKLIISKKQKIK